ncbi:MAG: YfiR family protein [Sedimentisphaerales bacterium]
MILSSATKMRIKVYNLIVLVSVLLVVAIAMGAQTDSEASREYQVKAAFLYNFIKFVDWPGEETSDSNEPIIIGIIGKDPFGDAFEPVKDKPVRGRKVIIKSFKGLEELEKSSEKQSQIETIGKCHMLFVCSSEKEKLGEIINLTKDHSVLTVSDMQGFLESGGIVNFVIDENKVGFEINNAAARHAKLQVRSQLLRLAKRVVEEKPPQGKKN